MKWKKWFLACLMLVILGASGIAAQAATSISKDYMTPITVGYTYKGDINGDGKEDTVYETYAGNYKWNLYINSKKVATVGIYAPAFWNYNSKDKYIEILIRKNNTTYLYRYNGKKLVKLATRTSGKISWLRGSDTGYILAETKTGDKSVMFLGHLKGFASSTGNNGMVNVLLRYQIKNKKLVFAKNSYHEVYGFGTQTAKGNMVAYNKASTKAKKLFTLKAGQQYTFKKMKFTKKYTFVQVQNISTNQTGWIIVKTSQLRLSKYG